MKNTHLILSSFWERSFQVEQMQNDYLTSIEYASVATDFNLQRLFYDIEADTQFG